MRWFQSYFVAKFRIFGPPAGGEADKQKDLRRPDVHRGGKNHFALVQRRFGQKRQIYSQNSFETISISLCQKRFII